MSIKHNYGFAYQTRKIHGIRSKVDEVIGDSEEAGECMELEAQIADLVATYDWVFEKDIEIRTAFATGTREYDPSFDEKQTRLLKAWRDAADYLSECARKFESTSPPYDVVGIKELRKRLCELDAILTPSDLVNEQAEVEAIEQHRLGETEDFSQQPA